MKDETMREQIARILSVSMMPYKKKLEQASKQMAALEERIDSVLDRSFVEDQPGLVCGEVFEGIKGVLDDTAEQLDYLRNILMGTVLAWHYFPEFNEGSDDIRYGFVNGYMRRANEKEDE